MVLTHVRSRFNRGASTLLIMALCALLTLAAALPAQVVQAQGAQRINFPPGGTSANVGGFVTGSQPVMYVLRASAGQQMTVGAGYVNGTYQVAISDSRGAGLGVATAGASWTGTLPSTGDYYLTVSASSSTGGTRIYFNLVISIVSSQQPTPPPAVERINFASGAISATVNGSINPNSSKRYVLRALANQQMTVQTNSTGPFRLSVSGADGQNFGTVNANETLQAQLTRTQDYYITLQSPTDVPTTNYTMRVTVVGGTPAPTPTPVPARAQRIQFAPGAITASVNGYVDSSRPVAYVLRAMAGQNMTVQMSGGGPYQANIAGADGVFLGSVNANNSTTVRLPSTQDYTITIYAPAGAPGSNFNLTVTVVGSTPPPTPVPSTQRIQFAPGATSATVYGSTPQKYVLKAMRGQTMIVELYTDTSAPVQADITTAGGQSLGSATQAYPFTGQLPATQDYYFYVQSPVGASRTNFTLRVSIY